MQTIRSGSFTVKSWQICTEARQLPDYGPVKRAAFVPFWAWQFVIGIVIILLAVTVFSLLVGAALRVPSSFLDDIGKTMARVAPQPTVDVSSEEQLKKVIAAMPQGKLRVATVDAEHGQVIFTITDRPGGGACRRAAGRRAPPGEGRERRDRAYWDSRAPRPARQSAMEDLKKKWFGN